MPLSRQRRFPRARSSVAAARAFALETLAEWGGDDRHDDVRLCVSELATNALLHGVPPGRQFCVALDADGPLFRVAVRDSGDGRPKVAQEDDEEPGGRGLRIVTTLADDFGVTVHDLGKTVWAVFKIGPPDAPEPQQPRTERGVLQPDKPLIVAAASWLLAQEALPRHQTVKLLGEDFRNHLEELIPRIESLAAGRAEGDPVAMTASAGVGEARRRLGVGECPGLKGEVERVKWLARSVMALREHQDRLTRTGRRPSC